MSARFPPSALMQPRTFAIDSSKADPDERLDAIVSAFKAVSVEFINENGGGPACGYESGIRVAAAPTADSLSPNPFEYF
jgi:hypothetical protein